MWTSRADIKTGSSFQQEINHGIEEADNLIYLISPFAIESSYCQQDVNYAPGLFHSKETFDSVESSLATALSLSHIGEVVVAV